MINLPVTSDQKNALVSIEQLTAEIVVLKQQTALNIVEIGRRLIQAKEQIPHGQWSTWLCDSVDFSHATANRFMQVATEFGNSSALRNLTSVTKVYALLELPAGEREEFINQPQALPSGEVKDVKDMTTRELQQAIKEKNRLQTALETAKADAKRIADEQMAERKRAADEIKSLKAELGKARDTGAADQKIQKLEADLREARQRAQQLIDQAKNPPVVIEKSPDEAVVLFRVQFDVLVGNFRDLLSALDSVADESARAQYRDAVLGLLERMKERLQ